MELDRLAERSELLNKSVWRSKGDIRYVSNEEIRNLQDYTSENGERQFRYCLHNSSDEPCHKMIIFHNRPQVINWHAQTKRTGQVFYVCLEGEMEIIVAIDKKKLKYRLSGGPKWGKALSIPRDKFRRVVTLSSFSIFLEIAEGPFNDCDTIWKTSL